MPHPHAFCPFIRVYWLIFCLPTLSQVKRKRIARVGVGLTFSIATPPCSMRMKFKRCPLGWSLCCQLLVNSLLSSLLCEPVVAAEEGISPLAATVIGLEGQARQTTDGRTWELLEKGDKLRAGALIQTGVTNAVLDLQLGEAKAANGNQLRSDRVRLFENSILGLKKLSVRRTGTGSGREIELDLRSGQMQGIAEPGALDYEVEFPAGVLGIRTGAAQTQATSFVLRASGAVTVFSGKLVVSLAEAQPVPRVLNSGQQFDPGTRGTTSLAADAPERKLPLLPADPR